jgi:hypothetical protein
LDASRLKREEVQQTADLMSWAVNVTIRKTNQQKKTLNRRYRSERMLARKCKERTETATESRSSSKVKVIVAD